MVPPLPPGSLPVFGGAVLLGLVHGAEPGHGWPIAATYALERRHKWRRGLLASVLLGLGHLVSSLAVVAVFFIAKSVLHLDRLNVPLSVLGAPIGGPLDVVAGGLLVALGVREYRHGHSHGSHGHSHDHHGHHGHSHDDRGHSHDHSSHEHGPDGSDGADHPHSHGRHEPGGGPDGSDDHVHDDAGHRRLSVDDLDRSGLTGLVWTAFVLGFVHEEEIEIIGLCLAASFCLGLMVAYALAVVVALVGLTLLLVAGYYRYEDRVERYAEHFPTLSAIVLVVMGLGIAMGLF